MVYFLKQKTGLEIKEVFDNFCAYVKTQTGQDIWALRIDNRKEYVSKDGTLTAYFRSLSIHLQTTALYSSAQNGIAEWLNCTLVENTHAMCLSHNMPISLWPEVVSYACYLKNRLPTCSIKVEYVTPYEAFTRRKPDVSTHCKFGIPCWVLHKGTNLNKVRDPKSQLMTFVGQSDASTAWRYYNLSTWQIKTSCNVIFHEWPVYITLTTLLSQGESQSGVDPAMLLLPDSPPKSPGSPAKSLPLTPTSSKSNSLAPPPAHCSARLIEKDWPDYCALHEGAHITKEAFLASDAEPLGDPHTIHNACNSPDWPQWKQAMDWEMAQHKQMGTFQPADLPTGRKAIGCQWRFMHKYNGNGNVIKYKACLVI
jgi:hypothetical protein